MLRALAVILRGLYVCLSFTLCSYPPRQGHNINKEYTNKHSFLKKNKIKNRPYSSSYTKPHHASAEDPYP